MTNQEKRIATIAYDIGLCKVYTAKQKSATEKKRLFPQVIL